MNDFEEVKTINIRNKIIGTGIWSIVGTFLIKAVNLLSIPIFSRLLDTAEYGDVNLFMTYITIFAVLLGLDFNATLSKGSIEFKEKRYEYETASLGFTAIFSAVILAVLNVFGKQFGALLDMSVFEMNVLLAYSYATFVISYFSADCIFQFQYKKNTALSLLVVLSNLGLSVFLIMVVMRDNKYYGRILGAATPTILIALIVFIKLIKRSGIQLKADYIKYSLRLSVPLIPHHLSGIVLSQADKIMISGMIGKAENGIYSLVYNVGWVLSVLIEALNNVWMPWFYRRLDRNDTETVREKSILYLGGFSLVTILVEAISPELVKIIAPRSYWEGIDFVVWVVFAAYVVFLYYFYVNIECFYKKTYLVSAGTMAAAVINVLLNFWGLEKYGYGFAAISTVAAYVVLLVFHFINVRIIMKKSLVSDVAIILSFWLMGIYSVLMQVFIDEFLIRILIGAISVLLIIGAEILMQVNQKNKI